LAFVNQLGVEMNHKANYKFVNHHFNIKLKAGRTANIKKDEAAVVVFKNNILNQFSKIKPNELKITIKNNASFHYVKKLNSPNNSTSIFISPHSSKLNPAERVWQY